MTMNVILRPNRDLLDPNFESYKLSIEKIPQFIISTQKNVDYQSLASLPSKQHVQAYSQQNCLNLDPFVDGNIYYVDVDRSVCRLRIPSISSNFRLGTYVYALPKLSETDNERRIHTTIRFPSVSTALIYDGISNLYVFDTDRDSDINVPWKLVATLQPTLPSGSAQLVESAFDPTSNTLHCILASVFERPTDTPIRTKSSYVTYLDWFAYKISVDTQTWVHKPRHRRLIGSSFPDYVAFTNDYRSLDIFSERTFLAIYDSSNPNVEKQVFAPTEAPIDIGSSRLSLMSTTSNEQTNCCPTDSAVAIEWSQSEPSDDQSDMIHILFELKPSQIPPKPVVDQKWVSVCISPEEVMENQHQTLSIKLMFPAHCEAELDGDETRAVTLLDHQLYGFVGTQSTWTVDREGSSLEVHLFKKHVLHWPRLLHDVELDKNMIKNNQQIQYSASEVEHIQDVKAQSADQTEFKPPFNVEQLEEVDFTLDEEEDDFLLQRFGAETMKITHQSALSGHQWLLQVPMSSSQVFTRALCLRYDVDGLVWAPSCTKSAHSMDSNKLEVPWSHVATFQAFGYVLASKRDHCFVTCPPMMMMNEDSKIPFVAVADATKHVFIYLQPWATTLYSNEETEVRCRKSGDTSFGKLVHVARQHVVSLPSDDPIIGFVAIDKPFPACVVCTQSQLILLCICG